MINIDFIAQALLVAEHLSFSRAAQVLGVRQSAVSRRERALEDALGVSLLERDPTGVRLTDAGRRFLDKSGPALAEIDHGVKSAASAGRGVEGVLRIGILSSVSFGFVRDLLGHYHCYHPSVVLDLVEGSASEQIARITERHLDVAFVTGRPPSELIWRGAASIPSSRQNQTARSSAPSRKLPTPCAIALSASSTKSNTHAGSRLDTTNCQRASSDSSRSQPSRCG